MGWWQKQSDSQLLENLDDLLDKQQTGVFSDWDSKNYQDGLAEWSRRGQPGGMKPGTKKALEAVGAVAAPAVAKGAPAIAKGAAALAAGGGLAAFGSGLAIGGAIGVGVVAVGAAGLAIYDAASKTPKERLADAKAKAKEDFFVLEQTHKMNLKSLKGAEKAAAKARFAEEKAKLQEKHERRIAKAQERLARKSK